MIGSSIVKYIDAAKIEKQKPNSTKNICIKGGRIHDISNEVKTLNISYKINKMVIHVGGNHISHESPDAIIAQLEDMLAEIKVIMPETIIYFSLILP